MNVARWFATAWVVAAILATVLMLSGCAYINWQDYIAQNNQVEQVTNKSPWSDS